MTFHFCMNISWFGNKFTLHPVSELKSKDNLISSFEILFCRRSVLSSIYVCVRQMSLTREHSAELTPVSPCARCSECFMSLCDGCRGTWIFDLLLSRSPSVSCLSSSVCLEFPLRNMATSLTQLLVSSDLWLPINQHFQWNWILYTSGFKSCT
jgi:hypothetical protein